MHKFKIVDMYLVRRIYKKLIVSEIILVAKKININYFQNVFF